MLIFCSSPFFIPFSFLFYPLLSSSHLFILLSFIFFLLSLLPIFSHVDTCNVLMDTYTYMHVCMYMCTYTWPQTPVGAVIVNPTSGEVISKAHTLPSHQHPLWHAVMLCIDKVAAQQGGGAWEKGVSIGDGKAVESDSEAPPTKKSRSDEYLCSGYDLYTTREPCVMWVL